MPENAVRLRGMVARSAQILVEVAPDLAGLFVPGASLVGALGKAVVKNVSWMDELDRLGCRGEEKPTGPGYSWQR